MRKLSPARRRIAAVAGGLAAMTASSTALLRHHAGGHADFAFGFLFGVGLGFTLLIGLRTRAGRGGLGCAHNGESC